MVRSSFRTRTVNFAEIKGYRYESQGFSVRGLQPGYTLIRKKGRAVYVPVWLENRQELYRWIGVQFTELRSSVF